MPKISNRGVSMPASPIRKLVPFAEQALKEGKIIYYLNIGQPDIQTPPEMIEAVQIMDMKVLAYSHSAGNESYRKGLINYYKTQNIEVTHENILITTGGSEAVSFALMSCLDSGDEVIIPEPFYANYNGFAIASDIKIKSIQSSIQDGFALPPIEEFEKLITDKTKAIMICNPNNPTGYLYSEEELDQLRKIVLKHDLFLFADEVYREFCYDGRKHHSIMNMVGAEEHTVVIDSVSKRYSACGARIGALLTRNKEIYNAAMKFAQARLSPPTLAQIAAEAGLKVKKDYFEEVIEEYVSRRDLVVSELNSIDGVFCPNPGGAFYVMAQLPIDDADAFCQWLLESFDYNGETVMMAPASGFYATPGRGKQEVRIAYVLEKTGLKRAMNCLKQALQEYPNKVAVHQEEVPAT